MLRMFCQNYDKRFLFPENIPISIFCNAVLSFIVKRLLLKYAYVSYGTSEKVFLLEQENNLIEQESFIEYFGGFPDTMMRPYDAGTETMTMPRNHGRCVIRPIFKIAIPFPFPKESDGSLSSFSNLNRTHISNTINNYNLYEVYTFYKDGSL